MSKADSSAPKAPGYQAGDLIGDKYRLTELIGEGAMGTVWAARNEVLDSSVAIKLIRPDTEHASAGERLLKEARAASKLGHPAIVRIFDFGHTTRGDPYLVMERLEGESLADHLDRRLRLDGIRAVQTVLPIVGALTAAHEQGIVHRDVKPENIFLAHADGRRVQPKLLDFGVAKLGGPGKGTETLEGALVGSAPYMSPEQARGLPNIDQRADVWAISVVLYELVTGERPFQGPNYNAVMMAIVSEDPAPITARAAGDAELWSLIGKGLEKDVSARWESARDLGRALAGWLIDRDCTDDLGGASLQATWFDNRISSPPEPAEARSSVPSFERSSDRLAATVAGARSSAELGSSMRPARGKRPGRRLVLGSVVVVAIGAALAIALSTGRDVAPPAGDRGGVAKSDEGAHGQVPAAARAARATETPSVRPSAAPPASATIAAAPPADGRAAAGPGDDDSSRRGTAKATPPAEPAREHGAAPAPSPKGAPAARVANTATPPRPAPPQPRRAEKSTGVLKDPY